MWKWSNQNSKVSDCVTGLCRNTNTPELGARKKIQKHGILRTIGTPWQFLNFRPCELPTVGIAIQKKSTPFHKISKFDRWCQNVEYIIILAGQNDQQGVIMIKSMGGFDWFGIIGILVSGIIFAETNVYYFASIYLLIIPPQPQPLPL